MERNLPPSGEQPKPSSTSPPVSGEAVTERAGSERVVGERPAGESLAREGSAREPSVVPAALGAEGSRTFAEAGAPQVEPRRRMSGGQRRVLVWTWLAVAGMCLYGLSTMLAFFAPGYTLPDRIASLFLMFGLLFILMHGLGYANSTIKASWGYNEVKRRIFTPQSAPVVDCLVASFNEPREVVEETVAALANLDYPNKRIILLDDSTKEEAREAVREIGLKYNVQVVQRTNRRGYKAGAINDYIKTSDAEYVAVFDADALPAHNFLRDIVPIAEENPKLAFVQTPQHYANTDVSGVAMGASRLQAVFYEYIMEGKAYSRAAFCCGTNFVFRRAALLDVGGFDENSVTEDFVTSLNLHLKGYDSTYYNQIYVYSMAPETLPAYFTQQGRWAFGSVGAFRRVLGSMLRGGLKMRPGQWWEYFLSSTYYFVGWVNFVFMCLPIIYVFGTIKPLRQDVFTYLAIFLPYILFTMNSFYQGMEERGYKLGEVLKGQQLNFACFPVHMSAATSALLGRKRPFGVTPKGAGGGASWLSLWPQLLMMVLSFVAFVWGTYKYVSGQDRNTAAIVINSIWALYHTYLLSGVFSLNSPLHSHRANERTFAATSGRNEDGSLRSDMRPAGAAGAGGLGAVAASTSSNASARDAGGSVFATTNADGTVVAPPRQRTRTATGRGGRMALVLMALSLVGLGAAGWTMGKWYLAPEIPMNVYILDRTTGRDYQEHRALAWTLNFIKVHKQTNFGPDGASGRTGYDYARDFYGFVPGDPAGAQPDTTHQADLVVGGQSVELPETLKTPGALMLADTYGQFVEYDYKRDKYVRYQAPAVGISPNEVDRIQDFAGRGGLVVGEWNTLGYPTLPSEYEDQAPLETGLANARKALDYFQTNKDVGLLRQQAEVRKQQDVLRKYGATAPAANVAIMRRQVKVAQAAVNKTLDTIQKQKQAIAKLEAALARNEPLLEQVAAQKRLEETLHTNYLGFYGRYVDKFEEEHEYDFRLWKNVADYIKRTPELKAKYPNGPRGPGFVIYPDGRQTITNPETGQEEENPFAQPIILTQEDLRPNVNSAELATINRNPQMADDPLLRGVSEKTPMRYWFDVVKPIGEAKVLTFYKLLLNDRGLEKLKAAKFPVKFLKTDGRGNALAIFPATIASRQGDDLRSFYFAGDASDYSLVSRVSELVPATGGVMEFLGARTGPFPMQYYWNYYQPLMRNIFSTTASARYRTS